MPKDKFNVIYVDPPWAFQNKPPTRLVEKEYPTMELDCNCKLKVPSAEDAVLFLWIPNSMFPEGLEVVKAWGFKYKTNMVWIKNKIGMGYYGRSRHDTLFICIKGKIGTPKRENRPDSVIKAPREEHSKKPDEIYDIIEKMYPNKKYLELFFEKFLGELTFQNESRKKKHFKICMSFLNTK